MVYNSIWRDTYYTTTKSPFNYTIRLDGAVIFAGRAYAYPGSDETKVKINTICENYLSQTELTSVDFIDPSDVSAVTENPTVIRYFELWDEDDNILVETYSFLDCWDYDFNYRKYPNPLLSDPIDDAVVPYMGLFETRIYGNLTDSAGKKVFAFNITEMKELRSGASSDILFYLTYDDEPATRIFHLWLTNGNLMIGINENGGGEFQTGVNDLTKNWTSLEYFNYPVCNTHFRKIGDFMYVYSEDEFDGGALAYTADSETYWEEVVPDDGISITNSGSSALYLDFLPCTYEVKTILRSPDEDDPRAKNQCIDYALYYVNARGGWDSFCIQGATVKKDGITTYTTDRSYDNNTMEFETMRNITEIATTYELNTHYLTDEQSAKLAKHLLGSNMVYLHNFKDWTIKPVVIEDKAVTYQTYQTNGLKMAQYKITVKESQIKRRRK